MTEVEIRELSDEESDGYEAVGRLLPRLSSSAGAFSREHFTELLASPATRLLLTYHDGEIAGMLTPVLVRVPTGPRAHVEDVIVDESARALGIGRRLLETAVALARDEGAHHIDLSSRPSRIAANRLYQSLGFVQRETNVYRYALDRPATP